jgi:hypothetical protein
MTALTANKRTDYKVIREIELLATADAYYKGAHVGWDTATGKLIVAQASTTYMPVGYAAEEKTLAADGNLLVRLYKEVEAYWMANSSGADEVLAASVGSLCYFVDDQTVADNDATNTLSVAGRVWAVDSTQGVLVEPITTGGQRTNSGLDA